MKCLFSFLLLNYRKDCDVAGRRRLGEEGGAVLDLPLADLYDNHWSIHGKNVPGPDTPDDAVFLPGRNALLVIKAALWCQNHEIETLALAPLASNPIRGCLA